MFQLLHQQGRRADLGSIECGGNLYNVSVDVFHKVIISEFGSAIIPKNQHTNGFGSMDDMLLARQYLVAEAKVAGVSSAQ